MHIARDLYLNKLIAKQHNGQVKVITGLKGCGKSFLLFTLFKDHLKSQGVADDRIIEIAFDAPAGRPLCDPKVCCPYLKERLSGPGMHYVLLDEVQRLEQFEAVLNGLIRLDNADVYVTGSHARSLSEDVITEFRGRGDEVRMHPLSFCEFMSVYQGSDVEGLREYMILGGLPQVLNYQSGEDKALYLKTLLDDGILSEIKERDHIRNKAALEEIAILLSEELGSFASPSAISRALKDARHKSLSAPAAGRYLNLLADAFLIDPAGRYDVRGKHCAGTPFKCYFADPGLCNLCLNFQNLHEGPVLENIIFNELKLRGFSVCCGAVRSCLRQDDKKAGRPLEIDFVCDQAVLIEYFEHPEIIKMTPV